MKPPIFEDAKLFFTYTPLPIYIVSNIDTADLKYAVSFHDLAPAGFVSSEEACSYKPRSEIFNLALKKFGYAPDEVVHVGDSVTSDVLGAKAAGITPIWLNRKGKAIPKEVENYHNNLTDILVRLEQRTH